MNGLAHASIRAAAAHRVGHGEVDIGVRWLRFFVEQRGCGHDHACLTITALRNVFIDPGLLARMARFGGKSLNGGVAFAVGFDTGIRQDRTPAWPSRTVQAPHTPAPQLYFVPVNCRRSRNTHSSGMSGTALITRSCPLMETRKVGVAASVHRRTGSEPVSKHDCGYGLPNSARRYPATSFTKR
jgi:hypothetical protein